MGRRKKAAAKPAASSAASTAPKTETPAAKPRGRGRPRKYPLAAAPVKETEENSQSSLSTPDDISQDVPPANSPEPAVPSDDSSTAPSDLPANSSKKFGKFRILHSSSPSSSSGEQPSEYASRAETVSTPPVAESEEIVIESAMEVEIAPEHVEEETVVEEEAVIEPLEEHVMEVVHEELVQEEVVIKEEEEDNIKEEIAMDDDSPETAFIEEKEEVQSPDAPDEETKEEDQSPENPEEELKEQASEDIEPADFEKLSIKTEIEKPAEKEPKKSKGEHTDEHEKKGEDDKHKTESSHSSRRRSSRIKTIKATIDKVKAEKREQQREMKGAKEKEVSPEGTPIDESTSDSFPLPQGPPPSCAKPVKVKSRWRRSSELEMVTNYSPSQGMSPVVSPTPSPVPPPSPKVFQPLSADEERLRNFRRVDKNIYLTQRDTNKETKRMVCDCEPVDDDEMGCGEDCLNRMLMIECGPRCPLGDKCSNKRFQKMEYSPIDVFRTEKKGFGLQAKGNIKGGAFLAEYVGEVLDPYEFQCRAEDYANDKNRHYYFMALKSDAIIDATVKGNNSRFINHSCDPNAETQKWTVNGELRIGFFSIKDIAAGDEITFDYQLQRYGKEAQKCFCESANCRGWIGGDPDKEDKEEERSRKGTKSVEKKDKKSKPKPKFSIVQELLEDQDLENEVNKLCQTGLKNRAHTLNLSRLMVRVENQDKRKRMLNLLRLADAPCRRLFLDYHGLRLVWSWMVDPNNKLRLEIMETLGVLSITNKTVLQETKIFGVVEKWEEESRPPPVVETPVIKPPEEKSPEVVTHEEPPKQAEENSAKPEEVEMEDLEAKTLEDSAVKVEAQPAGEEKEGPKDSPDTSTLKEEEPVKKDKVENEPDLERLAAENKAAKRLLEHWSTLPEVFRIPKKERKEQLREHEREAERSYQSYLENRGYRAEYNENNDRSRQERYRGSVSIGSTAPSSFKRDREIRSDTRKPLRPERYEDRVLARMDKFQRRQLFAQRVEQEERAKREQMWHEEQERERQKQLSILQEQQQQMQPPHILMDANGVPCFFDAASNSWHAYHGPPALTPQQESPRFEPSAWQQVYQIPIAPLPPKWRAAYDKDGLPFYYHLKKRIPQWEPPSLVPPPGSLSSSDDSSSTSETESVEETDEEDRESGSSDDEAPPDEVGVKKADDDDSDEDDEVKENEDGEPCVPGEEDVELKNKDEDDEADDEEEKSETVQPKRENRRREGLVQELIIISPRREEDMPSIPSRIRYRKNKEQVRKEKEAALRKKHELHKSKDKSRDKTQRTIKIKSSGGTGDADAEKKIKDDFLAKMASTVVSTLNPFLKPECKQGRITCSEDFKHLARRLTNFVMLKELKHCRKVSDLTCNDSVKHKAREYIKKYMAKFGELYKRDNEKEHRGERHGQLGAGGTAQERQDDADFANYEEQNPE